jgi:hypothetical protein
MGLKPVLLILLLTVGSAALFAQMPQSWLFNDELAFQGSNLPQAKLFSQSTKETSRMKKIHFFHYAGLLKTHHLKHSRQKAEAKELLSAHTAHTGFSFFRKIRSKRSHKKGQFLINQPELHLPALSAEDTFLYFDSESGFGFTLDDNGLLLVISLNP